jgi:hypothetical protein
MLNACRLQRHHGELQMQTRFLKQKRAKASRVKETPEAEIQAAISMQLGSFWHDSVSFGNRRGFFSISNLGKRDATSVGAFSHSLAVRV